MKKVGETTRPLRYDINPIPYDYTVKVRNRFKIDRVPDELWMEVHDIVKEAMIKIIPKKKKRKKAQWLSKEALQIAVKRREVKSKGEKERSKRQRKAKIYPFECRVPKNSKERDKDFLVINAKK